jgi:hypothetical protein
MVVRVGGMSWAHDTKHSAPDGAEQISDRNNLRASHRDYDSLITNSLKYGRQGRTSCHKTTIVGPGVILEGLRRSTSEYLLQYTLITYFLGLPD